MSRQTRRVQAALSDHWPPNSVLDRGRVRQHSPTWFRRCFPDSRRRSLPVPPRQFARLWHTGCTSRLSPRGRSHAAGPEHLSLRAGCASVAASTCWHRWASRGSPDGSVKCSSGARRPEAAGWGGRVSDRSAGNEQIRVVAPEHVLDWTGMLRTAREQSTPDARSAVRWGVDAVGRCYSPALGCWHRWMKYRSSVVQVVQCQEQDRMVAGWGENSVFARVTPGFKIEQNTSRTGKRKNRDRASCIDGNSDVEEPD